ncbi:hypothetical protein BCR32DRAFT_293048 [Anaeromyces robustus]|uniref:Uncharacterized protein n=1 Tax=Anaeromyces robustus TaxID=1754192 RepID=A0A1Y1X7U8_9FUNG|nr:hypothetical protein BCR32DRAFT_293048 [Anaeromyces robustus]|eukprot:ORX81829.1 hypothetical protein BCR32DRAFT_293048 [Anaeromyces robustus]
MSTQNIKDYESNDTGSISQKSSTNSRRNTYIRQLNKSDEFNMDEDNSWGGVLTGNVKSRNVKNLKRSSIINPNDNDTLNEYNDDNVNYGNGYSSRYNNNKRQSFISYTESIHTSQDSSSDNDEEDKNCNCNNNNNNNNFNSNPSAESIQSPKNDYDETESSSSTSADIDDLISNDDPMLLNIINMSINNYKKNEQPVSVINQKDNTLTNTSINKHNSSSGISTIANTKRNISFQQNPIIINSIEEESIHTNSISSENQTNSSHNSINSSQSSLSKLDEELISPETLVRLNTCKEYLETRYNYIMNLINNGKTYNPLSIMRWRTRMWIHQATQGHINTLKKRKNKVYYYIDNDEIIEFQNHLNTNKYNNHNEDNNDQILNEPSNNNNSNTNNNSNNNDDNNENIGKQNDYKDNRNEIFHIKNSTTDYDLYSQSRDKSFKNLSNIESNSNVVREYNKRTSLPPVLNSKKSLNEEFISSYKRLAKKCNTEIHESLNESDTPNINKFSDNEPSESLLNSNAYKNNYNSNVNSNASSVIGVNNSKCDSESLINLFIPKGNNRTNKKQILSIVTNNLNNSNDSTVPYSAPIIDTHIPTNRIPKLSILTRKQSDINTDEISSSSYVQTNKFGFNYRSIPSRSKFSEIPVIIDNFNNEKEKDENHLDIPFVPRRRRSSMPDISHMQQQASFNQLFVNFNGSKKTKDKNNPNIFFENTLNSANSNSNASPNSNIETPTSTKNPLRKMLLRKRGKLYEQQENSDEPINNTNNNDVYDTSSNIFINNNNNNTLGESINIKKIFNMDSKGIRSIIKDIQPKLSITKSDLAGSFSSINSNNNNINDNSNLINSKSLKDNEYNSSFIVKKNININNDDKEKKSNLLKIKKIFKRSSTNGSFKNKRNSEILFQFENESDDTNIKKDQKYLEFNNEFYNDTENDTYTNTDEDESYYDKKYNEILENPVPYVKFKFSNKEFLQNNELLFNGRIVLKKSSKSNKLFTENSYTNKENLNDLRDKYIDLIKKYNDLDENIIKSINYNLIHAYYIIYNFMKELKKIDNFETEEMKAIVYNINNEENNGNLLKEGDVMDKEKGKRKKRENSISVDLTNENNIIIPDMSRRKSVINQMFSVKNRSFLLKNVTMDDSDNESTASSIIESPVLFEEPDEITMAENISIMKKNNNISRKYSNTKMESIKEYDNIESNIENKPSLDNSNSPININNNLYKKDSFNINKNYFPSNHVNEITNSLSIEEKNMKPYSKKNINNEIQIINKQYNNLENIINTINEQYTINNNKIEILVNEAKNMSYTLNDDLFIRLKSYEENKQNKKYFKKNIASEIGFITLDYVLTLIGGLYWLFYKFLKILKAIASGSKYESDNNKEPENNDKSDHDRKNSMNKTSSTNINNEKSLSINKINNENENLSNRNLYSIDSNNLSTNITENFRENLKRITDIINNSYNKSIEEENQIINLQKKLHELRSSNKPVNKEDIYSLIRRNDNEQKSNSSENYKSLDKLTSKEITESIEKNLNSDKLFTEIKDREISNENLINSNNNKNENENKIHSSNNNIDNISNNTNGFIKDINIMDKNNKDRNIKMNTIDDNNEINSDDIIKNNKNTIKNNKVIDKNKDIIFKTSEDNEIDNNKEISKTILISSSPESQMNKSLSNLSANLELKDCFVKRNGTMVRKTSKNLNINSLKHFKMEDKNIMEENTNSGNILNDSSNTDINQLISLTPFELSKKNSLEYRKEINDTLNFNNNDFIYNNSSKEFLLKSNSIISSTGLTKDESLNEIEEKYNINLI